MCILKKFYICIFPDYLFHNTKIVYEIMQYQYLLFNVLCATSYLDISVFSKFIVAAVVGFILKLHCYQNHGISDYPSLVMV